MPPFLPAASFWYLPPHKKNAAHSWIGMTIVKSKVISCVCAWSLEPGGQSGGTEVLMRL